MSELAGLVIRRVRILLPNGEFITGDVKTQGSKIVEVAANISTEGETIQEIFADGLTLLPGIIDPQVHFREPGLEYKEDLFTASCACAKGGSLHF